MHVEAYNCRSAKGGKGVHLAQKVAPAGVRCFYVNVIPSSVGETSLNNGAFLCPPPFVAHCNSSHSHLLQDSRDNFCQQTHE